MASESLVSPPSLRVGKCTFEFEIDYSESKDLKVGECTSSPIFTAGGYDWALNYYPQGNKPENQGYVSLFLLLKSQAKNITAEYSFSYIQHNEPEMSISYCESLRSRTFVGHNDSHGREKFVTSDRMKDVHVISCKIRVLTEPKIVRSYPGGLHEHIKKLQDKRDKFDVTFEVQGENIYAHRLILAARSPVFEAKLFGPMADAKMECIKIDEMKAEVFKALLHYIYTDQLPIDDSNDAERDDGTLSVELLQGLFVAADRYALEKLTLLCEEQLERNLSVDMVATTLLLADQHSRTALKEKCIDFASILENFALIAMTEGYFHIRSEAPALLAELSEKVKGSSQLAKKQRTG